ncbi:MAG: hypothetical protein V4509_01360 [Patescibacteria group bacterium]
MNSQNQTNKIVGIVIGIIVLGGIAYVLIFSIKDNNNPSQQTYTDIAPQESVTGVPVEETRDFGDDGQEDNVPVKQTTPAVTTPPADTTKKPTTVSVYKNGTYSATGSYRSPGGPDTVGVTLTISNDIVTSATVTNGAGDNTSSRYQDRFISGYQQFVVGQNIANIRLTKVSGASLTPIGFNDAVAQIKAKAKA